MSEEKGPDENCLTTNEATTEEKSNSIPTNSDIIIDRKDPKKFSIEISNATAKWTDYQNQNTLNHINLTVKSGQLVAVIGTVGAGKVYCI